MARPNRGGKQKAATNGRRAGSSRRRVLVVEDDDDLRETLAVMLELRGHRVMVAASGNAALQLARANRLDAALIDIGLPDISGHEVARQLRAGPDGEQMRLVALTGYSAGAERDAAVEAGFDAFAVKPISSEELDLLLGANEVDVELPG